MEFLADFHPKVIHFPVAFLIIYAVFEVIGVAFNKEFFSKNALLFLFLGLLGLIAAAVTGEQAEAAASRLEEMGAIIPFRAINEHKDWANYTVWYFTAVLIIRSIITVKKKFIGIIRYPFILFAFIGVFFLYEAAEHGGELVYKYGVGTELLKDTIDEE